MLFNDDVRRMALVESRKAEALQRARENGEPLDQTVVLVLDTKDPGGAAWLEALGETLAEDDDPVCLAIMPRTDALRVLDALEGDTEELERIFRADVQGRLTVIALAFGGYGLALVADDSN